MRASRRRWTSRTTGGLAALAMSMSALVGLSGCSGLAEVDGFWGARAAEAGTGPDRYFELIASNDPAETARAESLAAPQSSAAAYARHLATRQQAQRDQGRSRQPDELTEDDGTYTSCRPDGDGRDCVEWADVEVAGGRVAEFTVAGQPLRGRLTLGGGGKVEAGRYGSVEFVSAYQSPVSNSLSVTLVARSEDRPITVASYAARYRDPHGQQIKARRSEGPLKLAARATGRVAVVLPDAAPGGTLEIELIDAKDTTRAARATVRVG